MDWNDIDLKSNYERSQTFLDGYDFETLILELTCNYPAKDVNPALVRKHAIEAIQAKAEEAVSIIEHNMRNIAKEVTDYHKQD